MSFLKGILLLILIIGIGMGAFFTKEIWLPIFLNPLVSNEGKERTATLTPQAVEDHDSDPETQTCEYREKEIPIPKELASSYIIFTKDIRQAIGPSINGGNCLEILGKITRELYPPDEINQATLDWVFKNAGIVVEHIPARTKKFAVEKIIEFGGGETPLIRLILRDEVNTLYQISTVALWENGAPPEKEGVAVLQLNSKEYPLFPENFEHKFDPKTREYVFEFHLEKE